MSIRVFNRFKKKYFSYNSDVGVLGKSVCVRCDAMLFDGETKTGICCSNGKIKLRPLHPPTREIVDMYSGSSAASKDFLKNIRGYNSRFAFTSLGTKNVDVPGRGPPTFKIYGRMCHYIGQLVADVEPVFAQVYIHDEEEQARIRSNRELNLVSIAYWNRLINSMNPFAIRFRQIGMEERCSEKRFIIRERILDSCYFLFINELYRSKRI